MGYPGQPGSDRPDPDRRSQIRLARSDWPGPRRGRASQQNPADLWSRVKPGATSELRDHDHLVGLRAPVALRDLELDPLSLFEGAVAIRLDRREMDENVLATVDGDKAVSLVRVEPLDGALSHSKQLPNYARASSPALVTAEPVDRGLVRTAERANPTPVRRRPELTLPSTERPCRHLPTNHAIWPMFSPAPAAPPATAGMT